MSDPSDVPSTPDDAPGEPSEQRTAPEPEAPAPGPRSGPDEAVVAPAPSDAPGGPPPPSARPTLISGLGPPPSGPDGADPNPQPSVAGPSGGPSTEAPFGAPPSFDAPPSFEAPPPFETSSPADVDDDAVAEPSPAGQTFIATGPPPGFDAPPAHGPPPAYAPTTEYGGQDENGWHQQTAAPGWYPVDATQQRYWDGNAWTEHIAPLSAGGRPASDDTSMALLCHLGGAFLSFLVPLIIYLIKKDESPFIRHHAAEALNFAITVTIGAFVCIPLMFVLIGFLLLPILIVGAWVFAIVAAVAANRGEWYRYPINIRIVS